MPIRIYAQVFISGFAGKVVAGLFLAYCAAIGFGPDRWVKILTSWFAEPLGVALTALRVIFLVLAAAIIIGSVVRFIRRDKFTLEYRPDREIIKDVAVALIDKATNKVVGHQRGTYVHLRVLARDTIEQCSGAITLLEKVDGKKILSKLEESRPLVWAPRENGETNISIAPGVPRDLDIFCTSDATNKLTPLSVGHPFSWDTFFDDPGHYRITVAVTADGVTRKKLISVTWKGKWNDFEAIAAQ